MAGQLRIAQRLDQILEVPSLKSLVATYFEPDNPTNPFAGATFDTLGENPANQFVPEDLLSLNLLDVRLGPRAVRGLLDNTHLDSVLTRAPADVDLWEATADDRRAADQLLQSLIDELFGVGATRASKLCTRKRPRLIPIRDSVIERVLDLGRGPWREELAIALSNPRRQARLKELDPGLSGYQPTVLRLTDVAIWMVGSRARTARRAREALDLPSEPLW